VKALESLLVERRIVDAAALDAIVDAYETKIGPRIGAAVMARAWVDPVYKARLLSSDSTAAIAELGFSGLQGEDMAVVENTPAIHNLIVCTLCSCYPWPTLGLPPVWYKSASAWCAAYLNTPHGQPVDLAHATCAPVHTHRMNPRRVPVTISPATPRAALPLAPARIGT
jgi:hypothetical protein